MNRDQLLELARKYKPLPVEEDESGSLFERFCLGALEALQKAGLDDASVSSSQARAVVRQYVKDTPEFSDVLEFVGYGSSRMTFALQDGSAIKFAYNEAGVEQNKKEAKMMQGDDDVHHPECFPTVYEHTDDWRGMRVQCCSPIEEQDFDGMFSDGFGFNDIMQMVEYLVANKDNLLQGNKVALKDGSTMQTIERIFKNNYGVEEEHTRTFVEKLFHPNEIQWKSINSLIAILIRKDYDNSTMADLWPLENWGMIIDKDSGQTVPVVLDMGFDEDVYSAYYSG